MSARVIRLPRVTMPGILASSVELAVPGWGELHVHGTTVELRMHQESADVVKGLSDGEVMSRLHDAVLQTAEVLRHRSELLVSQADELVRSLRLAGVLVDVGDDEEDDDAEA